VSAAGIQDRATFAWEWQGRPVKVPYETLSPTGQSHGLKADGRPVLLPAFSTVSTRKEMLPLAGCLATQGLRCILIDWPGFGDSTRGRLNHGPQLYHSFLADFAATAVPPGAAVVQPDTPPPTPLRRAKAGRGAPARRALRVRCVCHRQS